jgi:hypothetical protein
MAKKSHKSTEMTSEEAGVEVVEAGGRAHVGDVGDLGDVGDEMEPIEFDEDDSDAFDELDAEFEELAQDEIDADEDDDELDVVDEVDEVDELEVELEVVDEDEIDEDDFDEDAVVTAADESHESVALLRSDKPDQFGQSDESEEYEESELIEDDASGWLPDPKNAEQERFWDGTEWTDEVRPVEEVDVGGRQHLPDHVPELQRALAAATADIDDVEARLSTLFDRGEGRKRATSPSPSPPLAPATATATERVAAEGLATGGPPIHEEFGGAGAGGEDASRDHGAGPMDLGREGTGQVSGDDDDDEATFSELDAALVAETPEKPDRRLFKRRT